MRVFKHVVPVVGLAALLAGACSSESGPVAMHDANANSTPDGGEHCTGLFECGDGSCVDIDNDALNCGACGKTCGAEQACLNRTCVDYCGPGTEICAATCVDTDYDPDHCGACGEACDDGAYCWLGECEYCTPGTEQCDGQCVDLGKDESNCGSCDNHCVGAEYCADGVCCGPSETNCSDVCVDLQVDKDNCEACGNACPQSEVCREGGCVAPASCADLLEADPSAQSGPYILDPDGQGEEIPFMVYCDMETDDGGWTLVARISNGDAHNWIDDANYWYSRQTPNGATDQVNIHDEDMISRAFWRVKADEFRISRSDNANQAHLLKTLDGCMGGKSFREHIASFGDYSECSGDGWALDNVKGSCDVSLGGNYATTAGFEYTLPQNCEAALIGGMSKVSFFADWGGSGGDSAIVMIGGGGDDCGRSDHGIGITEESAACFGGPDYNQGDFGWDGDDGTADPGYALNLWVK